MIDVFYSNRFESLVNHFIETSLAGQTQNAFNCSGCFDIVVPNSSVANYIDLYWARRIGISVNMCCVVLDDWIEKTFLSLSSLLDEQRQHINFRQDRISRFFEEEISDMSIKEPENSINADYLHWRLFFVLKQMSILFHSKKDEISSSFLNDKFFQHWQQLNGCEQYRSARKLAQIFYSYAKHRPSWLQASEIEDLYLIEQFFVKDKVDYRWQAHLWKILTDTWPALNVTKYFNAEKIFNDFYKNYLQEHNYNLSADISSDSYRLFKEERVGKTWQSGKTLSIIAPTYLSPETIKKLTLIAPFVHVNLFVLNPCAEYWFDLVSSKQLGKLRRDGKLDKHEIGHHLLSDWGQSIQALLLQVNNLVEKSNIWQGSNLNFDAKIKSNFILNPHKNNLAALQNEILNLKDRDKIDFISPAFESKKSNNFLDSSIQIHVCHNLFRQLEVCHDTLSLIFDSDPSIKPSDILIAIPDLQEHVGLIDAVFGASEVSIKHKAICSLSRKQKKIPYKIALDSFNERMPSSHNSLIKIFLDILLISKKTTYVDALFEWLDNDAFAKQYTLENIDKIGLKKVCKRAGARILFNLAKSPLPDHDKNSLFIPDSTLFSEDILSNKNLDSANFRIGITLGDALQRLLLAEMIGVDAGPVNSANQSICLLPIGISSGFINQEILNQLRRLHEDLFLFYQLSLNTFDIPSWCDLCYALLDTFFSESALVKPWSESINKLTRIIEKIRFNTQSGLSDNCKEKNKKMHDLKIDARTMHAILLEEINNLDETSIASCITSKVVFSTPEQARFIPYRIIAMLNFNDGVWPRENYTDKNDLLARFPLGSDFNQRSNDKAIFLDLILSARELLFISFNGRNPMDGSEMLPSLQVSTLLDYLADQHVSKILDPYEWEKGRRSFLIEHSLYPYEEKLKESKCQQCISDSSADIYSVSDEKKEKIDNLTQVCADSFYDDKNFQDQIAGKQKILFSKSDSWLFHSKEDNETVFELKELIRFWRNPCKYFFHKQLGVNLNDLSHDQQSEEEILEEFVEKDFSLFPIPRFQLINNLIRICFSDEGLCQDFLNSSLDERATFAEKIVHAMPDLPIGVIGSFACSEERKHVERFISKVVNKWNEFAPGKGLKKLDVRRNIDFSLHLRSEGDETDYIHPCQLTIRGRLDGILPNCRLLWSYPNISVSQILVVWIEHLVMNALLQDKQSDWNYIANLFDASPQKPEASKQFSFMSNPKTVVIGNEIELHFKPVDEASIHLAKLINLFQLGCITPLPFFLKTCYELAKNRLANAKNFFFGSKIFKAENSDPYCQCAFNADLLNDLELKIAKSGNYVNLLKTCKKTSKNLSNLIGSLGYEIYAPLLEHLEEVVPKFDERAKFIHG